MRAWLPLILAQAQRATPVVAQGNAETDTVPAGMPLYEFATCAEGSR